MSKREDNQNNVPNNVKVPTLNNDNSSKMKVIGSNNVVQVSADCAIWDTIASKFVKPEDTNFHSGK